MFSKSCEYGLRATIFIAGQSTQGRKVSLKEIAKEINSPEAFTAKILQQLTRNKIVRSIKGPYGGFEIEEAKMSEIRLSDVVNVLDGDSIYTSCGLGLNQCSAKSPCPLHYKFAEIRGKLRAMLRDNTLESLINDMDADQLWLK